MRIAVLASPKSWYLADLRRAAAERHEIVPFSFGALQGAVGAGAAVTCGGVDLTEFDTVLVRTMPPGSLEQVVFRMDLLARLERAGVLVLNPPRAIEAAVGRKTVLDLLPMQAGDVEATEADTSALQRATGFNPDTPVEEGVKRFVAWYRDYYKA